MPWVTSNLLGFTDVREYHTKHHNRCAGQYNLDKEGDHQLVVQRLKNKVIRGHIQNYLEQQKVGPKYCEGNFVSFDPKKCVHNDRKSHWCNDPIEKAVILNDHFFSTGINLQTTVGSN